MAVVFGILAGLLFGLFAVTARIALHRGGDAVTGASVITGVGCLGAFLLSIPELGDARLHDLYPFLLVGLFVPGASQFVFLLAVRDAGPARASVIIGSAPLLSVAIALIFLDEQFEPLLLFATVLVVAGGAVLAFDRSRPANFRVLGAWLALLCAVMFSVRDNLIRWATQDVHPPPIAASATSLLGAFLMVTAYVLVKRRGRLGPHLGRTFVTFLPVGIVLAGAYTMLVLGFDRGRVGVVAPLNATQSMWGVLLSAVFLRRTEAVGRKLVVAAALVVAGSAIVGAVR